MVVDDKVADSIDSSLPEDIYEQLCILLYTY
jgi:hypothetical protein